jgi:uncharacterized membrane protein
MEIWKDIKEFEGYYQVSNLARIKSIQRLKSNGNGMQLQPEKIKNIQIQKNGYQYVNLYKDNKNHTRRLHRLVAEAFIPNRENKPDVNHIDANKTNNLPNNLEWATKKENTRHLINNGLGANQYGRYTK